MSYNVTKNFADKSAKTISIKYEVDDRAVLQATKAVRQLQAGLKKFARL